jgi:hypothetical protein
MGSAYMLFLDMVAPLPPCAGRLALGFTEWRRQMAVWASLRVGHPGDEHVAAVATLALHSCRGHAILLPASLVDPVRVGGLHRNDGAVVPLGRLVDGRLDALQVGVEVLL